MPVVNASKGGPHPGQDVSPSRSTYTYTHRIVPHGHFRDINYQHKFGLRSIWRKLVHFWVRSDSNPQLWTCEATLGPTELFHHSVYFLLFFNCYYYYYYIIIIITTSVAVTQNVLIRVTAVKLVELCMSSLFYMNQLINLTTDKSIKEEMLLCTFANALKWSYRHVSCWFFSTITRLSMTVWFGIIEILEMCW